MKRRLFLIGLATTSVLAAVAGPALAATYAEDVVAQLNQLGFSNITVETTWLGRIKILATRGDGVREIILNPRTGEILRDVWMPMSGDGMVRNVLDDVVDGGHGGNNGGDRGGDNSGPGGDDDGGGNDNSGHGSGGDGGDDNSGSGGNDADRDDRTND